MTLSWMFEAAIRALVLAAVVGGALRLLHVRNPHIKLAVWRMVLVGALTMPLLMELVVVTFPSGTADTITNSVTQMFVPDMVDDATVADVALTDVALEDDAPITTEDMVPARSFDWGLAALVAYFGIAGAMLLRLA